MPGSPSRCARVVKGPDLNGGQSHSRERFRSTELSVVETRAGSNPVGGEKTPSLNFFYFIISRTDILVTAISRVAASAGIHMIYRTLLIIGISWSCRTNATPWMGPDKESQKCCIHVLHCLQERQFASEL